MKKLAIIGVAAALCGLVACEKDDSAANGKLVYREFTAAIAADGLTRVELGEPQGAKVPVVWQTGDQIKLIYSDVAYEASVTSVSDGVAVIAGTLPAEGTPTAAYYPADAYEADGTPLPPPSEQVYGQLPLRMTGTVNGNKITFSAASGSSAVVGYSLTGDIVIEEAYLYCRDQATFFIKENQQAKPDYTLRFETPLQLSEMPQKIWFVVPAAAKVMTLEVKTAALDGNYGVTDYKFIRRKVTALDMTAGQVRELPALDFTAADLKAQQGVVWRFGTNHGNAHENWLVSNGGSLAASEECVTATMGVQTVTDASGITKYRGDLKYTQQIVFHAGNYRYVAFKSSAPGVVTGKNMDLLPSGSALSKGGTIKFDINTLGQWRDGTTQSGTIATGDNKTYIWYYDMLTNFVVNKINYFANTVTPTQLAADASGNKFQFKMADLAISGNADVAPTYDVYWIGFFNSVEEIAAFAAEN